MASLNHPDDRQTSPAVKLTLGLLRLEQALAALREGWAGRQKLSPLQMQLLLDIDQQAGGGRSAAHFARRYGLSAATLSDSLRVLLGRFLLRRTRASADQRRWELALTTKGKRIVRELWRELDQLTRLAESLPPAAQAQSLEQVVTWIRLLADQGKISTDRLCITCRFFERDRNAGTSKPHWCHLIQAKLGASDLRVDCPEHELVPPCSGESSDEI